MKGCCLSHRIEQFQMGRMSTEQTSVDEQEKFNSQMEYKSGGKKIKIKHFSSQPMGENRSKSLSSSLLVISVYLQKWLLWDYVAKRVTFAVYLLMDQFYIFLDHFQCLWKFLVFFSINQKKAQNIREKFIDSLLKFKPVRSFFIIIWYSFSHWYLDKHPSSRRFAQRKTNKT